jgi:hypothetical protein
MTAFTPVLAHFCSQPIFSMTLARFLMGLLQGQGALGANEKLYCISNHSFMYS